MIRLLTILLLLASPASAITLSGGAGIGRVDVALPVTVCGNGVVEFDETCDDGGTSLDTCVYGDTIPLATDCNADCSAIEDCTSPRFCGDGVNDAEEECDDGNTTGGDGCSATCTTEVAPLAANAGSDVSGDTNAAIQLTGSATGGTGVYTYKWSAGASCAGTVVFSDEFASDSTATHDAADPTCELTLTVCDAGEAECAPAPPPALSVDTVADVAGTTGIAIAISGSASGGSGDYTYKWEEGAGCAGTVTFGDANAASTTITHSVEDPTCGFTLTVCDDGEVDCQ